MPSRVRAGQNAPPEKIPNCWGCIFFDSAQTYTVSRQNAFDYDECMSGSIIYTYVWNNPLNSTDPSGYFKFLGINITPRTIVAAAVAIYSGGLASAWVMDGALAAGPITAAAYSTATITAGIAGGAAAGFSGSMVMTNGNVSASLQGAVAGGVTGGFSGIGGSMWGTAGTIAGQGIGSGVSAQMYGGDFTIGLRYGLLGALRSQAFTYMQGQTDKLASEYWGDSVHYDANGNIWSYGGRGCSDGGGGQCNSFLSWMTMKPESDFSNSGNDTWNQQILGVRLGQMPVVGTFLNMVSKTHDFLNNALTVNTLYSSSGAYDYGKYTNTVLDIVSTAGMLPAAQFTSNALWQSPLQRK